jgi:hypothetical protein
MSELARDATMSEPTSAAAISEPAVAKEPS